MHLRVRAVVPSYSSCPTVHQNVVMVGYVLFRVDNSWFGYVGSSGHSTTAKQYDKNQFNSHQNNYAFQPRGCVAVTIVQDVSAGRGVHMNRNNDYGRVTQFGHSAFSNAPTHKTVQQRSERPQSLKWELKRSLLAILTQTFNVMNFCALNCVNPGKTGRETHIGIWGHGCTEWFSYTMGQSSPKKWDLQLNLYPGTLLFFWRSSADSQKIQGLD